MRRRPACWRNRARVGARGRPISGRRGCDQIPVDGNGLVRLDALKGFSMRPRHRSNRPSSRSCSPTTRPACYSRWRRSPGLLAKRVPSPLRRDPGRGPPPRRHRDARRRRADALGAQARRAAGGRRHCSRERRPVVRTASDRRWTGERLRAGTRMSRRSPASVRRRGLRSPISRRLRSGRHGAMNSPRS